MGESNPIYANAQPATGSRESEASGTPLGADGPNVSGPQFGTNASGVSEAPPSSGAPSNAEPIPRKTRLRWWLAPLWATALYISTHQAAKAAIASALLLRDQQLTELLTAPQTVALDGQRFIQRHFLSYGVYIPLEDIVIRGMTSEEPTIVPLMEQSCGEGQAYVWVPLRFQLPVVGEKVLEWCLVKA